MLGQDSWQHDRHYGINDSMDLSYDTFAEKLLYHNFTICLGEDIYHKKPLPNDQVVMPEPGSFFPRIPDERGLYYNYYYVTRDGRMEDTFYLTLYLGQPEKFVVDEHDYFVAKRGEGRWEETIQSQQYSFTVGQDQWNYMTRHSKPYQLFSGFADTLAYSSFSIGSGNVIYETNPLPGQEMVFPDANPDFPEIPYIDEFRNKHYYITRDLQSWDTFYLYLFEYEPTGPRINEEGYIVASQKYGNQIYSDQYTYRVGWNDWSPSKQCLESCHLYIDFVDTLI